jgi:D-alanyl-lipoteichoic acid acyltransferase DltB (MBOAT superfamily)
LSGAIRERRYQNYLLLCAGLYFYGSWDHRFLFLLLFSSAVDYIGALGIVSERPTARNAAALAAVMLSATFFLCAPIDWPGVWSIKDKAACQKYILLLQLHPHNQTVRNKPF